MNRIPPLVAALLVLGIAVPGWDSRAAEPRHGDHANHAATAPSKLQLNNGRKWTTDEALRKGMATLRATFAERVDAIHHGKMTPADYQALGARVESEVGAIVRDCKLEPRADAMLHLVVADLLGAADVMQGKAKGKPAAAAHKAVTALNDYGRYFDHPQWTPLK